MVEATGAASMLLEPVLRRGETVGVLVVIWSREMSGPGDFPAMVTSFLPIEAEWRSSVPICSTAS